MGALAFTASLSLQHVDAIALPGCGSTGDCARAARSAWATVPGIGLPVAFLALAYQAATLVFWLARRRVRPSHVRVWIALGAAGTLFYLGVSLAEQVFCLYCLATHACMLAFAALAFWTLGRAGPTEPGRSAASAYAAAAAASILAFLPFLIAWNGARQSVEESLEKSGAAIAAKSQEQRAVPPSPAPDAATPAFTGRYRLGPERAPVRVVVFSDYQCPDCKRLETEILARVRTDPRLSLSVKQFPLSSACNPHLDRDMHPNACNAARVAEAAGMLGGNDAFWAMNDWLYSKDGTFDQTALLAALPELGLDPKALLPLLNNPEIARRISADIEEGMSLGIQGSQTPMIFVNGVELRGWTAPNAFARAVDSLLATHPPALTASADKPLTARAKFLSEWSQQPAVPLPAETSRRSMGTPHAAVRVVLFGDYLEPNTAEADRTVRAIASRAGSGVVYSYQHFPFDQACNNAVPATRHPNACAIAKLVEAAGTLCGQEAFWRAHTWAFEDLARTRSLLAQGQAADQLAHHLSLSSESLRAAAAEPAMASVIAGDCSRAAALGLTELPWIYINGKRAKHWRLGSENLLPSLIEEAAKQ